MDNTTTESLIATLKTYDDAYFNSNPIVDDAEYDQLKHMVQKQNPDHSYFETVGADVRGGKIPLPFPMGSLDQVYDDKDINNWMKRHKLQKSTFAVSHKLDGVSCMIVYNHGKLQQAFSRGNGLSGADYTRHIKNIPSVPQNISFQGELTLRSEIIMTNPTFKKKYLSDYKTARGLVSGSMNRKVTEQSILNDIDVITYDIVSIDTDDFVLTKQNALTKLNEWGFKTVEYDTITTAKMNRKDLSVMLTDAKDVSDYELDGVVVTTDEYLTVGTRKGQSLNPTHSVKFKVLDEDSLLTALVVAVHWEISKSRFLKPRVEIEPVELYGTTVRFASGFNAKFINDNNIGEGTLIKITKSGSVIPYIVEVVKSTTAMLPDIEWEWNENGVEIMVEEDNETVIFKQCLDFFVSLDVELLKEATLHKMFDNHSLWGKSFVDVCEYLFSLIDMEWVQSVGTNGGKICDSLHRRLENLTMDKFIGSLPFMGFGFGVRKAKTLLGQIDINNLWNLSSDDIVLLDGFDTITASKLLESLPKAKDFLDKFSPYITIIEEKATNELENVVVVMTGFRDKDLKANIESRGGKVTTAVSKKTTHLLTMDVNSNRAKFKKARDLNVEIATPDSFKDTFNL